MKRVYLIAVIAVAWASGTPIVAQQRIMPPRNYVLLEENFDAGIPVTWTNLQFGYTGDIWLPGFSVVNGTPDVFHEWFCDYGIFFRDNVLLSPPIDLSGLSKIEFSCQQDQLFPLSRNYNAIEVTTDGGVTFTPIYVETGTETGVSQIKASVDSFAGLSNVQIGFHYKGTIANEWSVDDFLVTVPAPRNSVTNLVAGSTATFTVRGCGVGNTVHLAFSLTGPGPTPTPVGFLKLSPPIRFLAIQTADVNGELNVNIPVPANATGMKIYTQAVLVSAGYPFFDTVLTNALGRTVQ